MFSDERLYEKVDLTINKVVNENAIQAGAKEIQKVYQENGYSEVSVSYETKTSQGFTEVIYKVNEGGKSLLRDVEFVGNTAFSSRDLRSQMKSKEVSLLSSITNSGRINNDLLEDDIASVINYYRDHGYLNARVVDTRRVRVDERSVDVVITIDEGEVYTVRQVRVVGARAVSTGDLEANLKTRGGETFSRKTHR